MNVRIILVHTSHPGNIGASARAMKNMGFSELYLVAPLKFPHHEATARASGADDILANAIVVDSLEQALHDCAVVYGTSARTRTLPWPLVNPREMAAQIQTSKGRVAIVFGREQSGLTNEELALCHYHVHIPTEKQFSSLNLAAAVQIMVYELKMSYQTALLPQAAHLEDLATADELIGFYQHLEMTLTNLQFLDPKQPKKLMHRLKRLFSRTRLEKKEVNILRGILSAMQRRIMN